jgi:hypothetical protein
MGKKNRVFRPESAAGLLRDDTRLRTVLVEAIVGAVLAGGPVPRAALVALLAHVVVALLPCSHRGVLPRRMYDADTARE